MLQVAHALIWTVVRLGQSEIYENNKQENERTNISSLNIKHITSHKQVSVNNIIYGHPLISGPTIPVQAKN